MSSLIWVLGILAAIPIVWFAAKIVATYVFPPEYSGRAFIKKAAKERGVDVSRIPDSAWNEIVSSSIKAAKAMAFLSSAPADRNWRANLVRQLDAQAALVANLTSGGRGSIAGDPTRKILIQHGVLKE